MSTLRSLPPLFGRSSGAVAVRRFLERAAAVDAAVLIEGETGTGKTLLARHLHAAGRRADAPFVDVNCAGVPEALFESELFGHARGAFTGAHADRVGLVASADGGTLFLDEIGEMPPAQQAKLLAAVEDRRVRPVGAAESLEVNFRLVSATCRALAGDCEGGRFRADLYHRIAVLRITLPPLRDRVEDIVPLARRFLDDAVRRHALGERLLEPAARERLEAYRWPGNLRQLAHVMEASAILAPGSRLPPALIDRLVQDDPPSDVAG